MPSKSASRRLDTWEGVFEPRSATLPDARMPLEKRQAIKTRVGIVREDFWQWAIRIPEPKFGILDFDAFPYQRELYKEGVYDDEGITMKCSQAGASAWLIRWAMFFPDMHGRTALYVFPKDRQLSDFSQQRIRPLIRQSEYLQSKVPREHINNVHQRQIGDGFFNLRGSQTVEGLESVDADVLALDEYDYLVAANIPNAEKRVSGPLSLGLIRRIGFPTIPGYGVAKKYEESDQRRWNVRCDACGEWQDLDFHLNVDQNRMLVVCRVCTKPLDVKRGQWVASYPERDVRGYHWSRLIVPNAKIADVVKESRDKAPFAVQNFWNRTLGLPFAPKEGRLSLEAIQAAQSRGGGYTQGPRDLGYDGPHHVTLGCDVASVRSMHVRISEHFSDTEKRALFIGEVDSFNDLPSLMEMYGVHLACVDHLPEGRLARGFAERYPGRVYLVSYATAGQADVLKVEEQQRRVSVRRTEAHDAVIQVIREGRNHLPLDLPEGYIAHMQAPVRFVEKDEMDKVTVGYRATGPDDFFQAEVYDIVANEMWWLRVAVDEITRQEISTLEDHAEFERSVLHDRTGGTYFAGPADKFRG